MDSRIASGPRGYVYYEDPPASYYHTRRDDYPYGPHPDAWERSRPPRSYRNLDERTPKSHYDDPRRTVRERDLEMGEDSPSRGKGTRPRPSEELSIDGYDYDKQKIKRSHHQGDINLRDLTPEQRKQVLRLPWIQWMNSEIKNRKSRPP